MAKIKIDFTGVEESVKCAEGTHFVKMTGIEEKVSQAGNEMLSATFEVTKGDSKGAKLYENFLLSQTGLWKLKSYLSSVGVKADGKIALDPNSLVGKQCLAEVIHEEYNGKQKAKIDEFKKIVIEEDDEDEDDLEDDDIEDDDEEEEEDEKKLEDMTVSELKEVAKGMKIKGYKDMKKKKLLEAINEALDEEEDEEVEEKSKKASKGSKKEKGSKKKDKKKVVVEDEDDDEDDDDDWDDED